MKTLCNAVRLSIRAVSFHLEIVDGVVKREGGVGATAAWKCVRKDRHRGKHRDQDGNEW